MNYVSKSGLQQYSTALIGFSITENPLKSTQVSGTGTILKVNCARECGNTPSCKAFSVSSSTNQCYLLKIAKLCDTPKADAYSSVHYLI